MNYFADQLINDGFFSVHPEKILGTEKKTTNQFGKPVTVVTGKLNDALFKFPKLPSPVVYKMRPAAQDDRNPDYNTDAVKSAIEKTEAAQSAPSTDQYDLLDMDEVLKKFHPDITKDDLQLWVFYQRGRLMSNAQILNKANGWSKYVIQKKDEQNKISYWLKNGRICYDGVDYIPYYLYYSGNIYEKINSLKSRKSKIISVVGESVYLRQLKKLDQSKPAYLEIQSAEGSDLYISPMDPIAKEFKILETLDGNVFENEVSLLGAFFYFLDNLDVEDFKNGSSAMDIQRHWIHKEQFARDTDEIEKITRKRKAQQDGLYLFEKFLRTSITRQDQQKLEYLWNSQFNAFKEPDYNKIPVGLEINRYFKNTEISPRKALWEGVKFLTTNGSGVVAFDVGVGKTMTSILAMAQALYTGQCKRPLVVVPNPTYAKWIAETVGEYDANGNVVAHGILPQYRNRINDYYNLGVDFEQSIIDNPPKDFSITFVTYEGFVKMGFSVDTQRTIENELFQILNQGVDGRDKEKLREKIDSLIGSALSDTVINFDDLGFDYLVVDEAHNFKKIFTKVKGRVDEDKNSRNKNPYEITSGEPSTRGIKLFMISQYVLRNNNMRNVVLLTATPFTNSPLEIYSMLALVAYQELENRGIKNIIDFFDKFINETYELGVNARGKIENKAVIKSFNNRIVLQNIIFNYILHKTGEEANVPRPKKVVYPLYSDDRGITLPIEKQVDTALQPNADQEFYMREISRFANEQTDTEIEQYIPKDYYKDGKLLGRVLIAINLQQSLTLSPYLVKIGGKQIIKNEDPTYLEYIESSPKLQYVMDSILTIREWHLKRNEPISGVVIYMNRGSGYFGLIKAYLVSVLGYAEKEVAIIKGGISKTKKESIKKKFLAGDMKVIIGSATIKEGIDLQNKATTLFNCNLDWNPTDMQQVEGRIWRQGNQHSHVRIVVPMIENSVDVFMFQKLDEKTSRINDIWYRSGKGNVLDVDQLNPEDLKMALMTDPEEAAKSVIKQEVEKLNLELASLKSIKSDLITSTNDIEEFKSGDRELRSIYPEAEEQLKNTYNSLILEIKDENLSKTKIETINGRIKSLQKVLENGDEDKRFYRILKAYATHLIRNSWGYNSQAFNLRNLTEKQLNRIKRMARIQKNILNRFNLTIQDDLSTIIKQYDDRAVKLAAEIGEMESDDVLQKKIKEIKNERKKQQKFSKEIPYRVKQFTSHNHLLSCLKDIHDCKLCPKEVVKRKGQDKVLPIQSESQDVEKINNDIYELKLLIEMVSDENDKKMINNDIAQLNELIQILK